MCSVRSSAALALGAARGSAKEDVPRSRLNDRTCSVRDASRSTDGDDVYGGVGGATCTAGHDSNSRSFWDGSHASVKEFVDGPSQASASDEAAADDEEKDADKEERAVDGPATRPTRASATRCIVGDHGARRWTGVGSGGGRKRVEERERGW